MRRGVRRSVDRERGERGKGKYILTKNINRGPTFIDLSSEEVSRECPSLAKSTHLTDAV